MIFDERLRILVSGGMISPGVEDMVRRVIKRLETEWHITLTEENGGRMVTHLAMALMRIREGEKINAPDEDQFDEFKTSKFFAEAVAITDDLVSLAPLSLAGSERAYLIINICLIMEELNDG